MTDDSRIFTAIERYRDEMIEFAREILSIPALAPQSGGDGELEKCERIMELVDRWGFDEVLELDAPDDRVGPGLRPNRVLRIKGEDPDLPSIWVFSHMDVVPPGDLEKWTGDPWILRMDGDRMIARGIEDNGQGLVASLFAARAVIESGLRPKRDVNVVLVADEEVGSDYGISFLLKEHPDLISREDLIIVPDAGEPDGDAIEVAEKSIMWVRIHTKGKQVHASTPAKGVNAHLAAMRFAVSIYDELKERYPSEDALYDHPFCSFEPTKKEGNVAVVNAIPGDDVIFFDCRILPEYDADEVLEFMRMRAGEFASEQGVAIEVTVEQMGKAAPPTDPDHPVVKMLIYAIGDVYGVDAKAVGIGGGTCAAILRRAGYPAAVWCRIEDMAHQPDEYALISNYVGDAKVLAKVFIS